MLCHDPLLMIEEGADQLNESKRPQGSASKALTHTVLTKQHSTAQHCTAQQREVFSS
jgi:hypothetical protein